MCLHPETRSAAADRGTGADALYNQRMGSELSSLTIFFPCHNERDNLERVTRAAIEAARSICSDFEIIIVNDGSTDGTAEVAEQLAADHAEVRVIHHETNKGYGGALQSGFRAAKKEWVFYTDGDGQFDIREIARLVPHCGPRTIVSAYRSERQDPPLRKFNGWCWNVLVNLVFGLRLRDIDCAFKLYPAKLFEEIELRSVGALIDTEVLAKADRLGYSIRQLGVSHLPRLAGEQSGGSFRVILRAFKELFQLRRHILQTVPRCRIK